MSKIISPLTHHTKGISRRELLKFFGSAGAMATLPFPLMSQTLATPSALKGIDLQRFGSEQHPDWMVEARIFGLSINGLKIDPISFNKDIDSVIRQGANVIESDTRLSDYLSEQEFEKELQLITDAIQIIHQRGLKAVWYIPALELITPNGRLREDTVAKLHPDWLQLSFDRKQRGVFYGKKVFWVEPNDESAWLCPNSPYRDWLYKRLARLAATGIDGLWLDVPIFGLVVGKWGCACGYCREKFTHQTGMEFPTTFDLTDKRFWQYVQWRHRTLTEFLEGCRKAISAANSKTVTIAEVVSLDHLGATEWGTEGSQMSSHYVVWEQDGASEGTSMADASYDDWVSQYSSYRYCRGATMDRPSWAFSYGFNEPDAQLVMAGTIATQNNPYELRVPKMTTSVGMEFRGMMYNWIAKYSALIFRSKSLAPVAIVYSARNRDFLDAIHQGGLIISGTSKFRDRSWLGTKTGSPLHHEYMGDYRGLSLLLYQHQIPTDIYPITRIDSELLSQYPVLVLPYMAILDEDEKQLLLRAVKKGSTLIVSGPKPGFWDANGSQRKTSLWDEFLQGKTDQASSHKVGKGSIHFWCEEVGRNYLRTHSDTITSPILNWIKQAGVEPWTKEKHKTIVQPYIYENKIIVHALNYEWTGHVNNEPSPLKMELTIPWPPGKSIINISQSEPQWETTKSIGHSIRGDKLIIPLTVDINSLVVIET